MELAQARPNNLHFSRNPYRAPFGLQELELELSLAEIGGVAVPPSDTGFGRGTGSESGQGAPY